VEPIEACWSEVQSPNPHLVHLRLLKEKVPVEKRNEMVDAARKMQTAEMTKLLRKRLNGGFDLPQSIKVVIILPIVAIKLREFQESQLDLVSRYTNAVKQLAGINAPSVSKA
jgi:hypothetical protein